MKRGSIKDRATRALIAAGGVGRRDGFGAAMLAGYREFRGSTSTFTEPQEWLLQIFGTQSKSGAVVNENSALTVATFAACVNILAKSMSNFPLRLMQRTPAGAVPAEGHPLYRLMDAEPNETQTSYRWRTFMMSCLCLGGNAYSRIRRNKYYEVESVEPMLPFRTQPRALKGGIYDGTVVYRYEGEQLMPQDVIHIRGLSTDGFFGISPIRALRESLGLSLTMQEFTSRTFNNGARKPGVFEAPTFSKEKAMEFLNYWQQTYGGAQNAGKNPFFYGGITWKESGFSNEDAQLLLMRQFEKSEIANWFCIPEVLLGNTEKTSSWGTGIEQLTRGFVMFTLAPWAKNWEQELDRSLLTTEEKAAGYFFRFDFTELLRGSLLDQANFAKTLWGIGAATQNEIRRTFHMTELPDGPANMIFVPANMITADKAAAQTIEAAAGAGTTKPAQEPEPEPSNK